MAQNGNLIQVEFHARTHLSSFQDYPRISPFLWFDTNAEEAAAFYVSIFPNSRQLGLMRNSAGIPSGPAGSVLTVSFELDGIKFTALNGGRPQIQRCRFVRCTL